MVSKQDVAEQAQRESLGITRTYNPQTNSYFFEVNTDKINPQSPRELSDYVDAVAYSVCCSERGEGSKVEITGRSAEQFKEELSQMQSQALKKYGTTKKVVTWIFGVGATAGAVATGSYGYSYGSDWAVSAGDYLHNASRLWAPVSGLIEIALPVITTVLSGAVGAAAGVIATALPIFGSGKLVGARSNLGAYTILNEYIRNPQD